MADFIPPAKPLIGAEERAAVDRVLRSGMLAQGPEVAAFEAEFAAHFDLGRPCVAVNSGTSALHLGLLSAGVGRGRRGHRAVVHLRGDRERRRPDGRHSRVRRHRPGQLLPRSRVGRRLDHGPHRGRSCRCISTATRPTWANCRRIADRHGLQIFEDAAQAHGASLAGTPVGAFGAFASVLALSHQEHDVR